MGLYEVICPECSAPHQWHSSSTDQRCAVCIKNPKQVSITVQSNNKKLQTLDYSGGFIVLPFSKEIDKLQNFHVISNSSNEVIIPGLKEVSEAELKEKIKELEETIKNLENKLAIISDLSKSE